MKAFKYLIMTALVAGTFGAGAAHAEMSKHKTPHEEKANFKSLDTDKNGSLSEAEYNAHPAGVETFSQVDTDRNGSVSMNELAKAETAAKRPGSQPYKTN